MIHNHTLNQSTQRLKSPLTFVDINIPRKVKQQSALLKSPHPQNHSRLKKVVTFGSSSPAQQQNLRLSFKENLQPQSRTNLKVSFGQNYTVFKEAPNVKFNKINTFTVPNIKPLHSPSANFTIQPFTLNFPSETSIQEEMSQKNFSKIRELGRGKFGIVWMARHKKTNFLCALKIIKKSVVRQEKIQHQVAKQLRIHNKLKHQNIINFYGFFADEEHFYIVTEYATQGHVYGKLRKQHRLQELQVKDLTKQTTDGLRFIHNMGYIHRDIKPQNLLLQFGTVKICDFGWAVECMGNQMRRSQCGTPLYYSPELVRRDPHNTQIDVWSVGLLAYELMVGRVPFKIWSEFDLPVILQQEVKVPDYVDASYNLKDFVYKCLKKDQTQRPTLFELKNHIFITQGMPLAQSISGLYEEVKSLF